MKRQKAKVLPSFADKDNSSSEQDYITTPLIVTYDTSDVSIYTIQLGRASVNPPDLCSKWGRLQTQVWGGSRWLDQTVYQIFT